MKTEIEFKVILSSLFNMLPGDADVMLTEGPYFES